MEGQQLAQVTIAEANRLDAEQRLMEEKRIVDPKSMGRGVTEDDLQRLYRWIDGIPLSRPKRHMGRDFSDAGIFCVVLPAFPSLSANSPFS